MNHHESCYAIFSFIILLRDHIIYFWYFSCLFYLLNYRYVYNESCQFDHPIIINNNNNDDWTFLFPITSNITNNNHSTYTHFPTDVNHNNDNASCSNNSTATTVTIRTCNVFSNDYFEARTKFRERVTKLINKHQQLYITLENLGIVVENDNHNNNNNNDNTIDIAVIHGKKSGLMIHQSGVHGIEGYTGSAIQIDFLDLLLSTRPDNDNDTNHHYQHDDDEDLLLQNLPTIVLIHTLNPYGMAKYRRTNENNVDLNRNGLTIEQWNTYVKYHTNKELYHKLDTVYFNPILNPPTYFYSTITIWFQSFYYHMKYPNIKQIRVNGQYYKSSGIFYGGGGGGDGVGHDQQYQTIEKSISELEYWLKQFFINYPQYNTNHIATTYIDIHTGLGNIMGDDTLIPLSFTSNVRRNKIIYDTNQIIEWFPKYYNDNNNHNNVQHSKVKDNNKKKKKSSSLNTITKGYDTIQGIVMDYYYQRFFHNIQNHSLLITQEFGTIPTPLITCALIIENAAYHHYMNHYNDKIKWSKWLLKPSFDPNSRKYRKSVILKGLHVLRQAIQRTIHLSSSSSSSSFTSDIDIPQEESTSSSTSTTTSEPKRSKTIMDEVNRKKQTMDDEL